MILVPILLATDGWRRHDPLGSLASAVNSSDAPGVVRTIRGPSIATIGAGAVDLIAVTVAADVAPRKFVTSTTIAYTPPGSRSSARSASSDELIFAGSDRILPKIFPASYSDVTRNSNLIGRPPAPVDEDAVNRAGSHAPIVVGPTRCASTARGFNGGSISVEPKAARLAPSFARTTPGLSSIRSATLNAVRGIAIGSLPV